MSWRKSGADRGKKWQWTRRKVFERDGWRCQRCGKRGRLECHHLDGVEHGHDPDRLTTLCRWCHIKEHRKPARPGEAAWRKLVDDLRNSR